MIQKYKNSITSKVVTGLILGVFFGLTAVSSNTFAQERFSLATGSTGGAWYVLGGAWTQIVNKASGLQITPEISKAGKGNIKLISAKKSDFAVGSAAVSYEAFNGIGWAKGKKYENLRVVAPVTAGYYQWWSMKDRDNITTIKGIEGKSLCLSTRGGDADVYGRKILKFFNVKGRVVNAPHVQCLSQMVDNLIQIHGTFADAPHPAPTELASRFPIAFIEFSEGEMKQFLEKYTYLSAGFVPANTYKTQDKPIRTLATLNSIMTHQDMDPDVVYKVTKATWETRKALLKANKAATALKPENLATLPVPVHAGALRYYKEVGMKVPKSLIPPEAK